MKRTTLALEPGDVAKLRDIAEQLGYLADSGPTVGTGSISKLMRAIADGDAVVTQVEPPQNGNRNYPRHQPMCECGKPATTLVTLQAGTNGKQFREWMCDEHANMEESA